MALPRIDLSTSRNPVRRRYMQLGEQEVLLALLEVEQPRVMVEIGVNAGLTALAVLENIKSIERYIGIDVPQSYRFEIPAQQVEWTDRPGDLALHDPRFELVLRGEMMPTWADCVFIDGDHGRNAVLQDSLWAAELIKGKGLIIWHDYGNPTVEVTQVLDELYAAGRYIRHITGTWLAFEML